MHPNPYSLVTLLSFYTLELKSCDCLVFLSLLIYFLFLMVRVKVKKNPLGGKTRAESPFESLTGQHVFVGTLPVKIQERVSQQTGSPLFTVVQMGSVRLAFEAHDPGGLFSVVPPTPHTHTYTPTANLLLASTCQQSSFSGRWCLSSTNHKPLPPLRAHRCEPMNNTCFSEHVCPCQA